ncbi:MAG: C10 family peptidase [Bacteroidales bacterium]|nr:C10 family peptidase [Bacteroidales bacterium]
MKKSFLLVAILLAFNSLFADNINVEQAREFGHKFVKANFEQKENNELDLVYTMNSESGEPCFYVFNVSDYGFVMVSATDLVRPILGYSENGIYEVNNVAPGLGFMMEDYQESISYALTESIEAPAYVKAEWAALSETGKLRPQERGVKIGPLCQTAWDQSWPYNYYCPELNRPFASNGRSVVGCVATAMSQIMRYWSHPTQGTGSHSYKPQMDEYGYPEQSANFGETTYDWDNMPYQIKANSPQKEIEAVALLGYHCGVSVNMMYDDDGTGAGAYSSDVPWALMKFFGYAQSSYKKRTVSSQLWDSYIKDAIQMGRPIFYAGTSKDGGGHAFICDGMDENGLFHYNFGWSGSGDGFFASTATDYPNEVGAIFDIMPKEIYNSTMEAPKNVEVVQAENNELSATLTWKNPVYTVGGSSSIKDLDKIVIERNGEVIAELTGMKSGETASYVDNSVPCYSYFEYSIYAVVNGSHGKIARVSNIGFGPTCKWQLILQSSAFQGLRGANVTVLDKAGVVAIQKTTENSQLTTYDLDVPQGDVQFIWNPADENQPTYTLTMILKDYTGKTIFNYTGPSEEMRKGVFKDTINDCGYVVPEGNPYNLVSKVEDNKVVLNWYGTEGDYGFNIYRDGVLIANTRKHSYVDANVPHGGHCYTVTAMYNGGDTRESNETCVVLTENCEPATDLTYEINQAFRPVLSWTKPNSSGLTGYYVMRKVGRDGEWIRVKVLAANKTTYTDNSVNQFDTYYYYKVVAYYQGIDCLSAPANIKGKEGEFVLPFFYSETGVEDNAEQNVGIYPNPANEKITIEAQNIETVSIVNVMGQTVYETSVNDDNMVIDVNEFPAGLYMINVVTDEYEVTKRISVVH